MSHKKCTVCREEYQDIETVCPYCGSSLYTPGYGPSITTGKPLEIQYEDSIFTDSEVNNIDNLLRGLT